jgi:hypothetical protein
MKLAAEAIGDMKEEDVQKGWEKVFYRKQKKGARRTGLEGELDVLASGFAWKFPVKGGTQLRSACPVFVPSG